MKRTTLMVCLLACLMVLPVSAQRKKKDSKVEPAPTAGQLIQEYRFDEAAELLQTALLRARKKGEDTQRIESEMHKANMGADMLRGTEHVVFVDSFKVARSQFLDVVRLSSGVGSVTALADLVGKMSQCPAELGQVAYINDLEDRIFFAAANQKQQAKNIFTAYRSGNGWGNPSVLDGMEDGSVDQDYPFMMPDGVTLYYAAQGEGSLGGYDLFVTRFDSSSKKFLKSENVGMPFNSPANDYMLAIDELSELGWLVTDRNQNPDTVCVYTFIPNESREIYEYDEDPGLEIIQAAQLHSIKQTQTDMDAVVAARNRLQALKTQPKQSKAGKRIYVINDQHVYTSLSQFRSQQARSFAEQADQVALEIQMLEKEQDELMFKVAYEKRNTSYLLRLKEITKQLPKLKELYRNLCINMRKSELQ